MTEEATLHELDEGARPLPLDPELDLFRPPERQREALARISTEPHGRVLVAEQGAFTVGYLTFHRPDPIERWGQDRSGRLIELGAIEVAPAHRAARLGERLLERGFAAGVYDDTVVFAGLYAWHYDLARTGLGPLGYRRLLTRFYARVGLLPVTTSDPEIRSDRANALLARIGPQAPEEVRGEFERLRTLAVEAGASSRAVSFS